MSEVNYGAFEQAAHYHEGRVSKIQLVVVHCTAGQESAKGTGAEAIMHMFASPSSRDASAHITVDQNSICRSVHDDDTAWGAAHANSRGLHIEQVGMPDQTTQQWLDAISKPTINNCARVVRDWCNLYGLTKQILTVAQVKGILNGSDTHTTGITFHADVEKAWPSTGHTDPGLHYPRSYLLQQVQGVNPTPHPTPKPAPLHNNPYAPPKITSNPKTWLHMKSVDGKGQTGVHFVQWAMWGSTPAVDGHWGDKTDAIFRAWQKKVFGKADGICGPASLQKLIGIKHH